MGTENQGLNDNCPESGRMLWSLALHSAGLIAYQLALMQWLSMIQWHHFAYMVISIAMLGFGAAASLLALYRKRMIQKAVILVPLFMALSGLSMMASFVLSLLPVFRFDVYHLASEPGQMFRLTATYLLYFLPFLFGALSIGLLFVKHSARIGKLYFSNLSGSGTGGLLILLAAPLLYPSWLPVLTGSLSLSAAFMELPRNSRIFRMVFILSGLFIILIISRYSEQTPFSQYKAISAGLQLPEVRQLISRPGARGLVHVLKSPAMRYGPGLSLSFDGPVPVRARMYVNGDLYGSIDKPSQDSKHILDYTPQGLPWILGSPAKVLLPHTGTGENLAHALSRGADRVDALSTNPTVSHILTRSLDSLNAGMFRDPVVSIYPSDIRVFLARHPERRYDLIYLPLLNSFGGTAGLNALHEDYMLSLESFTSMWNALSLQGMLSISSWIDYPARTSLKILASLTEVLRQSGIDKPSQHLAALRSWGTITFVLTRSPLTQGQIQAVHDFSSQMYFDPALLPGLEEHQRIMHNMLSDQSLLQDMDRIMTNDQEVYRDYGFRIRPATDDRPFFHQFFSWKSLRSLINSYGSHQLLFVELGYLILLLGLAQSLLLSLLLILLPLLRLKHYTGRKRGTLIYFGSLGMAYMFVEMLFIQQFVLFLGHPLYAMTAALSTMLLGSGLGSLTSQRLPAHPGLIARRAGQVSLILILMAAVLSSLLSSAIGLPIMARVLMSLLLIGLPAYFMGMLFPLGIRYLNRSMPAQIPWAWGINACLSVISTSLATLIALEMGFRWLLLLSALGYMAAFAVFLFHKAFLPPLIKPES